MEIFPKDLLQKSFFDLLGEIFLVLFFLGEIFLVLFFLGEFFCSQFLLMEVVKFAEIKPNFGSFQFLTQNFSKTTNVENSKNFFPNYKFTRKHAKKFWWTYLE